MRNPVGLLFVKEGLHIDNIYQSIQGNMGLGKAISYFTSHGITVALPLNDTQGYDLIIDYNGLQRVSVKTSRFTVNNGKTYNVLLKNCGGSSGKSKTRYFDNRTCDYVFIYTANGNLYLIPSKVITAKSGIHVGIKYNEYLVYERSLEEYSKLLDV